MTRTDCALSLLVGMAFFVTFLGWAFSPPDETYRPAPAHVNFHAGEQP